MKNWLKIWVVALAICATATTLASMNSVQAGQDTSKKVEVTIGEYNGWINTCQLEDYIFNFTGSTEDQTGSVSHEITCQFWDSSAKTVTLQLQNDLSNWSTGIAKENVKLSNVTWIDNPATIHWSDNYAFTDADFYDMGQGLFTKIANTIWDATWTNVSISITVPAWTPNGTYTGTLVLDF